MYPLQEPGPNHQSRSRMGGKLKASLLHVHYLQNTLLGLVQGPCLSARKTTAPVWILVPACWQQLELGPASGKWSASKRWLPRRPHSRRLDPAERRKGSKTQNRGLVEQQQVIVVLQRSQLLDRLKRLEARSDGVEGHCGRRWVHVVANCHGSY